jgi:flavin reductase (DIM6/NTAB) family NADH-FMN oxidoreductase RutF
MAREPIPAAELQVTAHHLWSKQWLLLTSGDFATGDFNTMTVGWGSLGTMWNRPFAQIVVRPGRYTHEFLERFDHFTLSAFSSNYRKALALLGSKSGRDGDKISETGLTPIASTEIGSPGFAEAELILECRKSYRQVMDPAGFLDPTIDKNYPVKDYHTIYFGEILAVFGESDYHRNF